VPEHPETRANVKEVERAEEKINVKALVNDAIAGMTREEIAI